MDPRTAAIVILGCLTVGRSVFAAGGVLPFSGLSDQEQATIRSGKALIREAVSAQSLSLVVQSQFANEIRGRIQSLQANYVGEVIMAIPTGGGGASLTGLAGDLANVEGYVGIPYWSKRNQRFYELFDQITILRRTRQASGETVVAEQHMEPFSAYQARYSYELVGSELHFRSENLSTISYDGIRAVPAGNMVWYLYGFPGEGETLLYGVGAVKAFDMFGLFRERIGTSFMGRIQSFFSYMYRKQAKG